MDDADEEEGEEGEGGEGEEVDVVEALRPGGAPEEDESTPSREEEERASSLGDGVSIEGGTPNTAPPTPAKATPRSRVACRSSDEAAGSSAAKAAHMWTVWAASWSGSRGSDASEPSMHAGGRHAGRSWQTKHGHEQLHHTANPI